MYDKNIHQTNPSRHTYKIDDGENHAFTQQRHIQLSLGTHRLHVLQKPPPPSNRRPIFRAQICMILVRPVVNVATAPISDTTLRLSIKTIPSLRLHWDMALRSAIVEAIDATPLQLDPFSACSRHDVVGGRTSSCVTII